MPDEKRKIVYPSQVIGDTRSAKPGRGTFVERGEIYAERLGIVSMHRNVIHVNPLKGQYFPKVGDDVIGVVLESSPSMWMVDIRAPYPAMLHVREVPWDVEFGDTERFLNTGDTLTVKVFELDERKKINVTMKDHNLNKIQEGVLIEVDASKVPRIIGKKGSMISLIKEHTGCMLKVGKNGRIWMNGDPSDIRRAIDAIEMIDREAASFGLTGRVEEFLKAGKSASEEPAKKEDETDN